MEINKVYLGDCNHILKKIPSDRIDLVYFDPPFFTQKKHSLSNRENTKTYTFEDKFHSLESYLHLIEITLSECKRILKDTGSVFLHCDKTASHHLRLVLDLVFGKDNFQSEIVWSYKRWSNAKKGLLNSHQIIFFYSKTENFKFKTLFTPYSPTTNIDQILQERERNENGKSAYKKDSNGNVILGKEKKGVPLSDVWEIPYLNPKAKERTGYPTQKPIILLNQILNIASDIGDTVLDPYCGSGTTCVSAKQLGRNFIGIDSSEEAVQLTNKRLEEMIFTESNLLHRGTEDYIEKSQKELELLSDMEAFPVHRNSGIDGFLKKHFNDSPVPIKIQKEDETLEDCIRKINKASAEKNYSLKIIIQTVKNNSNLTFTLPSDIRILPAMRLQIEDLF